MKGPQLTTQVGTTSHRAVGRAADGHSAVYVNAWFLTEERKTPERFRRLAARSSVLRHMMRRRVNFGFSTRIGRPSAWQNDAPLLFLLTDVELRLIVGLVSEADALALALTSRTMRDMVFERFLSPPPSYGGGEFAPPEQRRIWRLMTPTSAALVTVARLRWAEGCGCRLTETMAELCASKGNAAVLDELRSRGVELGSRTCAAAARGGQLELLMRLRQELGIPWDAETCRQAASEGHVHVLAWAVDNGAAWDDLAVAAACRSGQLHAVRWAIARFGVPLEVRCCAAAARGGHLELLQQLREEGAPWCALTAAWAAAGGHLSTLQWAREHECPWDGDTTRAAARGGHLATLQWARSHGAPWHAETLNDAAREGHEHVVVWLLTEGGAPADAAVCAAAARGGQLQTLRTLRARAVPWDERTCACAAKGGHLAVLQWARDNGCPWDDATTRAAAQGGHLGTLVWARYRQCPWTERTCYAAAAMGHLSVLQWARANGCPWNSQLCAKVAKDGGHLETFRWVCRKGHVGAYGDFGLSVRERAESVSSMPSSNERTPFSLRGRLRRGSWATAQPIGQRAAAVVTRLRGAISRLRALAARGKRGSGPPAEVVVVSSTCSAQAARAPGMEASTLSVVPAA